MAPNEKQIDRAAQALCLGVSVVEVSETLQQEGLSSYDAFLAIQAARLLYPEVPDPFQGQ